MEQTWTKCWRWLARLVSQGVHDRQSGMAAAMELTTQMADAFFNRQDLNRHQPTEIDALNGYISRRVFNSVSPCGIRHCSRQ
jgi:ketopantoate reductase